MTVAEDPNEGLNVWDVFNTPARVAHYVDTSSTYIDSLSDIEAAIARALVHNGIVIWHGIPSHIIDELGRAGFEIRKIKKYRGPSSPGR